MLMLLSSENRWRTKENRNEEKAEYRDAINCNRGKWFLYVCKWDERKGREIEKVLLSRQLY